MAKYSIGHFGRKGRTVAIEIVEAQNKAQAQEKYLEVYCKQTKSNLVVSKADADAEVTIPRPRKAKVTAPQVESAPAQAEVVAEEPKVAKIEPKQKRGKAKSETQALDAKVVKPEKKQTKAQADAPKADKADKADAQEKPKAKAAKKQSKKQTKAVTQAQTQAVVARKNDAKNGIEVVFTQKPCTEVLDMLKSVGFRWSFKQSLWYAKQSDETLAMAERVERLFA